MIEGFVVGDREVAARLQSLGPALRTELRAGIGRLTIRLQTNVKKDFLSGQVLGVKTGRGRRSVEQDVVDEGQMVAGIVSTPVGYMIGWETGWQGGGIRKAMAASKKKFQPGGSGDNFKNGTAKKRAFLAPALKAMQASGAIEAEMNASVARAVKQ